MIERLHVVGGADLGSGGLGPDQPETQGSNFRSTLSFLLMRRCCKVTQSRGAPVSLHLISHLLTTVGFYFQTLTVKVDLGTLADAGGRRRDGAFHPAMTQVHLQK